MKVLENEKQYRLLHEDKASNCLHLFRYFSMKETLGVVLWAFKALRKLNPFYIS